MIHSEEVQITIVLVRATNFNYIYGTTYRYHIHYMKSSITVLKLEYVPNHEGTRFLKSLNLTNLKSSCYDMFKPAQNAVKCLQLNLFP